MLPEWTLLKLTMQQVHSEKEDKHAMYAFMPHTGPVKFYKTPLVGTNMKVIGTVVSCFLSS